VGSDSTRTFHFLSDELQVCDVLTLIHLRTATPMCGYAEGQSCTKTAVTYGERTVSVR
jgi:hypothetical protein